MKFKVMNICDGPMAFYYQRQTNVVNSFLGGQFWRYYYDGYRHPGCQHFIDLGDFSTRDEIMSVLQDSDFYIFHGTRNYRRPLYCRDGIIKSSEYPKGKNECILIHGQPETLEIPRTNRFIQKHAKLVRFFVATPNQLNLFQRVELLPIVGLFTSEDADYQPRSDYLERSDNVRIIRRSEWKAAKITKYLVYQLGMTKFLPQKTPKQRFVEIVKHFSGISSGRLLLPKIELTTQKSGLHIVFDNRTYWVDLFDALVDLREADILVENDWNDYPGGGTNHTIGMEAWSLGVASFNAMTKENSSRLAKWLGADRLLPLPNWEDETHYRKMSKQYLKAMIYDQDFRLELKRASRQFFLDWLDAPNVVPRLLRCLQCPE